MKDLKRKIQQAKLEKGETLGDLNDWGKGIHDRINTFEDYQTETVIQRCSVKKVFLKIS